MARQPEGKFKTDLDKEIKLLFPGCYILKNDANFMQGVPDRLILWHDRWAVLEAKKSANEITQPNQSYYVEKMNRMSFAAFIYPENKEEILGQLQQAFGTRR